MPDPLEVTRTTEASAAPRASPVTDGPDAGAIVGLLADVDRRQVLAAIELGAETLDQVAAATGLTRPRAARALGKLVDGRLVMASEAGGYLVAADVFVGAARAALHRPPSTEHAAEPIATRKVLDAFVKHGIVTSLPAAPGKRRVVLDWLARRFEPGRRYLEADVTAMLDGHGDDPVTLRRYLVDESLLDRAEGMYWRSGGTVDVGHSPEPPPGPA